MIEKEKEKFRKMFIVADLVSLSIFFSFFYFSFFDFILDFVHTWIHLCEFGMRICNKYSTVNNFNKPTRD